LTVCQDLQEWWKSIIFTIFSRTIEEVKIDLQEAKEEVLRDFNVHGIFGERGGFRRFSCQKQNHKLRESEI